jgi:hypothetical protein
MRMLSVWIIAGSAPVPLATIKLIDEQDTLVLCALSSDRFFCEALHVPDIVLGLLGGK